MLNEILALEHKWVPNFNIYCFTTKNKKNSLVIFEAFVNFWYIVKKAVRKKSL